MLRSLPAGAKPLITSIILHYNMVEFGEYLLLGNGGGIILRVQGFCIPRRTSGTVDHGRRATNRGAVETQKPVTRTLSESKDHHRVRSLRDAGNLNPFIFGSYRENLGQGLGFRSTY